MNIEAPATLAMTDKEREDIIAKYFDIYDYPCSGWKQSDIDTIIPYEKGLGGLYLGSLEGANDEQQMKNLNIQGVVSIIEQFPFKFLEYITNHQHFEIGDNELARVGDCFTDAFDFIDQLREKGLNVLIHCHAGVSRSGTITLAYLMRKNGWTVKEAVDYAKKKRGCIMPAPIFLRQLELYEQALKSDKTN